MPKAKFEYDIYILRVRRIEGVSRARMIGYIQDAVASWAGQFEPQTHSCEHCDDGKVILKKRDCDVCRGTGTLIGDPLGPPCPLMDRHAVIVTPLPRGTYISE